MGTRFHRSVKIAKGVRPNISKTGLGVSVGPRGAKISVGPSGVYSNVGIPGTGLYARNKLNKSSSQRSNHRNQIKSSQSTSKSFDIKISIDDETGKEEIIISNNGKVVNDVSLLRKIKSDAVFKEKLQQVREKKIVL